MAYAAEQAAVYLGGYSANRQGGQDMYVASFSAAGDLSLEYRRVNNQPPAPSGLPPTGMCMRQARHRQEAKKNSQLPASTKKPGSCGK